MPTLTVETSCTTGLVIGGIESASATLFVGGCDFELDKAVPHLVVVGMFEDHCQIEHNHHTYIHCGLQFVFHLVRHLKMPWLPRYGCRSGGF